MPEEYNQHWRISGDNIRHNEDSDRVFDVKDHSMDEGAEVIVYDYTGGDNQQWEKKHVYVSAVMFTGNLFRLFVVALFYFKLHNSGIYQQQ